MILHSSTQTHATLVHMFVSHKRKVRKLPLIRFGLIRLYYRVLAPHSNTQIRQSSWSKQFLADIRINACFICHKGGYGPWKHRDGGNPAQVTVANIELALASEENNRREDSENPDNYKVLLQLTRAR